MNYAYDFNYSIQLEAMPKPTIKLESSKELFATTANQLIQSSIFRNSQINQFVELLVKQPLFIKIGTLTSQLSEILLSFVTKSVQVADQSDCLREKLCECTQELNIILGRQKDYYLNVSILVLTLIEAKILWQKYSKKIERSELFHLLHWQIKGYHSTNVVLQNIQAQILVNSKVRQFLQSKKLQIQKTLNLNLSLSFGDIGRGMNPQKVKTSRFYMAMNKQNHNSNILRQNIMSFKKDKARRL